MCLKIFARFNPRIGRTRWKNLVFKRNDDHSTFFISSLARETWKRCSAYIKPEYFLADVSQFIVLARHTANFGLPRFAARTRRNTRRKFTCVHAFPANWTRQMHASRVRCYETREQISRIARRMEFSTPRHADSSLKVKKLDLKKIMKREEIDVSG